MATFCKVKRTVANSSAATDDSVLSQGVVNRATARAQFSGNMLSLLSHRRGPSVQQRGGAGRPRYANSLSRGSGAGRRTEKTDRALRMLPGKEPDTVGRSDQQPLSVNRSLGI